MGERQNLYFIAIVPPGEDGEKIIFIQQDISNRYDTRASLKVEPHITFKAPFMFAASAHLNVTEWFRNIRLDVKPFVLELKDFGAFPNPKKPVIYINPVTNSSLMNLQKGIIQSFQEAFPSVPIMSIELNFKPHLTVAYRDLKPEIFWKAWEEFRHKKFSASFAVTEIWLMQHDGVKWNRIESHNLS